MLKILWWRWCHANDDGGDDDDDNMISFWRHNDDNGDLNDDDIDLKHDAGDNLIYLCHLLNLIPDWQSSHYSTKSITCEQDDEEDDGDEEEDDGVDD